MTCYSTPPQPAPPPLGGRPDGRVEPGKDPSWWTQLVEEEKWWNRTWFRAVAAVSTMAVVWIVLEIVT